MKYVMTNRNDNGKPLPHGAGRLLIEVEAPYAEALLILDAARLAEQEIEQEKQERATSVIRRSFGMK